MNNHSVTRALVLGLGMVLMPSLVMADVAYGDFGDLPGANFGGTGIPNNAVAATNVIIDGDNKITIALTAHQRYSNPAVTNDGAGTYFAQTGANNGLDGASPAHSTAATWNFAYYMNIEDIVTPNDSPKLGDYKFTLYYDFDPGADTGNAAMGRIDFPLTTQTNHQDSQNLTFGFLDGIPSLSFVTPPTYATFDPMALGEYTFILAVSRLASSIPFAQVAIDVNAVPLPAAAWLFGSALLGLGWARRSRHQAPEVLSA